MRSNKYHAKKTIVDGIAFDSKKEAMRWRYLKNLEELGVIKELERQVPFGLLPAQKLKEPRPTKGKRQMTERAVKYIADFCYIQDGKMIVEDTKGLKTPEYILKRKMVLYFYGIEIREV